VFFNPAKTPIGLSDPIGFSSKRFAGYERVYEKDKEKF
jgi:hypothetical protein